MKILNLSPAYSLFIRKIYTQQNRGENPMKATYGFQEYILVFWNFCRHKVNQQILLWLF